LVRNAGQSAVLALEGKIHWEGNIEQMRQGRYLHEEAVEYTTEPITEKPIVAKPKERKKRNATDTTRHG
jgi:hypothetical protein